MNNVIFYFLTIGIPVIAVMIMLISFGECGKRDCRSFFSVSPKSKKKQENLKKIEGLLAKKKKITNNDVEKMLKVSDATTERYLNQLEKAGKLKQHGKSKKTYYTKV